MSREPRKSPVSNSLGRSLSNGYTPQGTGEPLRDVSDLIRCQLSIPGRSGSQELYIPPHLVAAKVEKYRGMGQRLVPAKWFLPVPDESIPVPKPVQAKPAPVGVRQQGKPIIDESTGQYYENSVLAAQDTGIKEAMIRHCVRGRNEKAGGRKFRLATLDEQIANQPANGA